MSPMIKMTSTIDLHRKSITWGTEPPTDFSMCRHRQQQHKKVNLTEYHWIDWIGEWIGLIQQERNGK